MISRPRANLPRARLTPPQTLPTDAPTDTMSEKRFEERTAWVYDEQAFPVWNRSFDKPARMEMIRDDLSAGRSISILLAVLVAIGLVLALVTLSFVSTWR